MTKNLSINTLIKFFKQAVQSLKSETKRGIAEVIQDFWSALIGVRQLCKWPRLNAKTKVRSHMNIDETKFCIYCQLVTKIEFQSIRYLSSEK